MKYVFHDIFLNLLTFHKIKRHKKVNLSLTALLALPASHPRTLLLIVSYLSFQR